MAFSGEIQELKRALISHKARGNSAYEKYSWTVRSLRAVYPYMNPYSEIQVIVSFFRKGYI